MRFIPVQLRQPNFARQQLNVCRAFHFAPSSAAVNTTKALEVSDAIRNRDVFNDRYWRNDPTEVDHNSTKYTTALLMRSHRQAAIDLDHLTCDVTGVIGKKKAGDARHFIRFGKAAEGNLFENFAAVGFIECTHHVG